MTVSVPSPFEAKASWVPGSNRHASTPWPIGTVVTSAPLVASEIAMSLLRQPLNSRWWTRSMASPVGDSQGAIDHWRFHRILVLQVHEQLPVSRGNAELRTRPELD